MVAVVLALAGAASYGLSDFLGGLMSRRAALWPTALTACIGALIGTLVLAVTITGHPHGTDFVWAALAGIGSGAGTAFLYRGMAAGRMGVVAPISAVGAAALPVLAGVVGGERPSMVVWVGIVLAFPAIWLVAQEGPAETLAPEGGPRRPSALPPGVLDGALAGVGFGLLFAALGQVPEGAGYWPLTVTQLGSVLSVAVAAVLLGGDPRPRGRAEYAGLVSGLLASLAVWCFLLSTERGLLTVSAVLVSLYPASTVLLAVALLRERVHRAQLVGLGLCAAAVVCVALG